MVVDWRERGGGPNSQKKIFGDKAECWGQEEGPKNVVLKRKNLRRKGQKANGWGRTRVILKLEGVAVKGQEKKRRSSQQRRSRKKNGFKVNFEKPRTGGGERRGLGGGTCLKRAPRGRGGGGGGEPYNGETM